MSDVKCPYCGEDQEIRHDDGYGYDEDKIHEQECGSCGKTFSYTTQISFGYDVRRADCLNGAEHNFCEVSLASSAKFTRFACIDCGFTKDVRKDRQ